MPDVMVSRKQRLRTLENDIRSGMEEFYYTGMKLKEIRDDELYKEDGFDTWEAYCRQRWDWSRSHVHNLITSSEYREKLPTLASGQQEWSERSVRELRRIPDKKDAAKVAAKLIKAVEQSEKAAVNDPEAKPLKLTASVVRKFVDADLGIDRSAKAKETKKQREEDGKPDLRQYLVDLTGSIEAKTENLQTVSEEAWKLFSEDNPGTINRLIAACESLTDLLRKCGQ